MERPRDIEFFASKTELEVSDDGKDGVEGVGLDVWAKVVNRTSKERVRTFIPELIICSASSEAWYADRLLISSWRSV